MAGWLNGRAKLAAILGLLKDQTAAGLARASGPFPNLHFAIIMATNHHESLPEEKYVEEVLAAGSGSRIQVSFCTRLLVKRLNKTQNWAVAIKCLVILHRSLLDGGFLFQDLLAYGSLREGQDYLSFAKFRFDQASGDLDLCFWVKNYAKYLDERLRCSLALKTHLDYRWKGEITQNRVEFMESGELIYQLEALQNLLDELCHCEPGEAGQHPVIQGALVLVVMDSYKVQEEIRFRMTEMLGRIQNLELSESLTVLHGCKRADSQMEALQTFLENCKELRLLSDIPLPEKPIVSKQEIQNLTQTIQSLQREQNAPSYTRSVSTGGNLLAGGIPRIPLDDTARKPFRIEGGFISQIFCNCQICILSFCFYGVIVDDN